MYNKSVALLNYISTGLYFLGAAIVLFLILCSFTPLIEAPVAFSSDLRVYMRVPDYNEEIKEKNKLADDSWGITHQSSDGESHQNDGDIPGAGGAEH
jgi:hypothetical protein